MILAQTKGARLSDQKGLVCHGAKINRSSKADSKRALNQALPPLL
jgi:hypothetical protein